MGAMKKVILVGDGMGDYALPELAGRTPLQAARLPHVRRIAAAGRVRLVQTVPPGIAPGSDVANLSLLGYNPLENYTGRAPIEAAGAGIPLDAEDVAFRCNLVTVRDGRMDDYSAGHITTAEAAALIDTLNRELARDGLRFHTGVSYRHLLVWRHGPADIGTTPPHEISDRPVEPHLPAGDRQDELRALITASARLLPGHPVNQARVRAGQKPATQAWFWGQGRALTLRPYAELYGLRGGVISAVDLIRGLGLLAGLQAPRVPGATGFVDTNYDGKVRAALDLLQDGDFVFMHVEAPDECGHQGNLALKLEAIEQFDARVVGPVWRALEENGAPYRLLICTDHRTPVKVRGHTPEPVPMACLDGPVGRVTAEAAFDEDVDGGRTQVLAFNWIRDLLRDAPG